MLKYRAIFGSYLFIVNYAQETLLNYIITSQLTHYFPLPKTLPFLSLERFDKDELIEKIEAPGLWEQMYFGLDENV